MIDSIQRVSASPGCCASNTPPPFGPRSTTEPPICRTLFFNEPWFLLEGLGFGALGWIALGAGSRQRQWVGSAIAATLVLTVIELLSATGVIGKVIIG